tara:strand:+ start:505 stop:1062 length:558 start_codon:yes stop_codon:yes gene_type:complete
MIQTSSVYEIPANKYNDLLANALKQIPEFKAPEWSLFVKTGVAKTKPSQEPDFWFKRAASILRQAYIRNVIGVNRLKTRYGSKKNRGYKPERFRRASGKMIRVILQQAEAAGLLEKSNEPGKRAGRKLTEKGMELMENIKLGDKPITPKPKPIDISPKQEVVEEKQEDVEDNKEVVEEQENAKIN